MTPHLSATEAFADITSSGFLLPPTATPLGGEINTWTREIFATADGAASAGYWQASTGRSYWELDYTEVIQVLAGKLVVTEEGGEPLTLVAGDSAVFPNGWKGEWDVVEDVQKFYVVFP